MRFSWDEKKRRLNLKQHGLDFVDAPRVFEGPTFTFEDDRESVSSPFERRREMKKRSSSKPSKTDWPRVRAMKDRHIQASAEHPEADVRHIVRGIVRQGLKPVS